MKGDLEIILVRGLPGSGKTTWVKQYVSTYDTKLYGSIAHHEADDFFTVDGKYVYEPLFVKEAHWWCQQATRLSLLFGNNVVVANTFVTFEQVIPYLRIAQEFGANVHIHECYGRWKSIHSVPEEVISRMKHEWQHIDRRGVEKYLSHKRNCVGV